MLYLPSTDQHMDHCDMLEKCLGWGLEDIKVCPTTSRCEVRITPALPALPALWVSETEDEVTCKSPPLSCLDLPPHTGAPHSEPVLRTVNNFELLAL